MLWMVRISCWGLKELGLFDYIVLLATTARKKRKRAISYGAYDACAEDVIGATGRDPVTPHARLETLKKTDTKLLFNQYIPLHIVPFLTQYI